MAKHVTASDKRARALLLKPRPRAKPIMVVFTPALSDAEMLEQERIARCRFYARGR